MVGCESASKSLADESAMLELAVEEHEELRCLFFLFLLLFFLFDVIVTRRKAKTCHSRGTVLSKWESRV